jgi:hypothetical protein
MICLVSRRNPCRLYIHLAFTYTVGPQAWCEARTWTGLAFSTKESAWSVTVTGSQSRVERGPKDPPQLKTHFLFDSDPSHKPYNLGCKLFLWKLLALSKQHFFPLSLFWTTLSLSITPYIELRHIQATISPPFFGTHEAFDHPASFIHQVERRCHGWELNRQPLRLVLGTSPLSSGSLGSSRIIFKQPFIFSRIKSSQNLQRCLRCSCLKLQTRVVFVVTCFLFCHWLVSHGPLVMCIKWPLVPI